MNEFTIGHLRKLVNLAFDHVEKLRAEKAEAEMVEFVPNNRPVDVMFVSQAQNILDVLFKEKQRIITWFKATGDDVPLSHDTFAELSKLMREFDVGMFKDSNQGMTIITVLEGRAQ